MRRELIAYEDPKSHVSELFRTLRTNVQFINSNKKLRTLLVTSTIPNEGKSWISSNLAITFAQANKRVLLIDADMRKCSLYKIFRVEAYPGLSNYLAGMNENNDGNNLGKYVRETEVPNLYLLPAGNIPPNPSELLASSRMTALLNELKREFDLIIIDGTPSKLVTDAVVLSRIVDSTIIVTGHNMVKKDKTIDRRRISDVVFTDKDMLLKLNGIIHPAVKQRILRLLGEQKEAGRGICVVEAALFLEENYQEFCDEVWYVYTEEEIRIQRLMESRGYSREKSLGIIRNQVSDQVFREHTDYVIENNGDLSDTRRQIREGIERNETL